MKIKSKARAIFIPDKIEKKRRPAHLVYYICYGWRLKFSQFTNWISLMPRFRLTSKNTKYPPLASQFAKWPLLSRQAKNSVGKQSINGLRVGKSLHAYTVAYYLTTTKNKNLQTNLKINWYDLTYIYFLKRMFFREIICLNIDFLSQRNYKTFYFHFHLRFFIPLFQKVTTWTAQNIPRW